MSQAAIARDPQRKPAIACGCLIAAVVVLVWRRFLGDAFGWLVAAGGFALLVVYRYVDVGKLGPLPDMYEPVWFTEKKVVAVAQLVTVVAAGVLMVVDLRDRRHRRHLR